MRNLYVDRLRGLAALMVVLSHASGYIPGTLAGFPLAFRVSIGANGYHGVSLFFAISGFLITQKIINASTAAGSFSLNEFYLHRVGRIAPCLILMICLACLISFSGIRDTQIDWPGFPRVLLEILTFTYNLDLHHIFSLYMQNPAVIPYSAVPRLWNPLWSLSVEEVFYLCFPLMMLTIRNRTALITSLLIVIILGPIERYRTASFYWYFSNFDDIAIGCLVALIFTGRSVSSRAVRLLSRSAGLAIISATFLITQDPNAALVWGPTGIGAGAAFFLIGTIDEASSPSKLLFIPEQFGRLSYEVYLFHMILLTLLRTSFETVAAEVPNWQGPVSYISLAAFIFLLFGAGQLVSRYFSIPSDRAIKSLGAHMLTRNKPLSNTAMQIVLRASGETLRSEDAERPVPVASDGKR
jgi:peptidoglycan/LPS O-acetylase OafA/YrhL